MGREIMRVPVDFDWPLNKVWKGYINPFSSARSVCRDCDGSGYNTETKQLSDQWYSHNCPVNTASILAEGEASEISERTFLRCISRGFTEARARLLAGLAVEEAERQNGRTYHPYVGWQYHLTQDEVDVLVREGRLVDFVSRRVGRGWRHDRRLAALGRLESMCRKYERAALRARSQKNREKLRRRADMYRQRAKSASIPHVPADKVNEWSKNGFGHDAINQYLCVRQRAKRLGVYGHCPKCGGSGDVWTDEGKKLAHAAWERSGPPTGDGWQVWETVSEGSPVSPVFSTAEELIDYLVSVGEYSEQAATAFVRGCGWVPSAVMTEHGVARDIEAAALLGGR